MYCINSEFSSTYEIKKSKFIAHIVPFNKYIESMSKLKELHPKARHFVYAYRFKNEFNQIVENSSDDGEPKGTSGKPSLTVLAGANIINTAVIIVRYFGGTRLGTGGLVRAYGNSVKQVIDIAILDNYIELYTKQIELDYSLFSKVEYLLNKYNIALVDKTFTNNIQCILEASENDFISLSKELHRDIKLKDIENVK
jgi:uncharacterized YigZ family protein